MLETKTDIINFLISEIDQLEPPGVYYEYYFNDLIKSRVACVYDDAREGLRIELQYLETEELLSYMLKHSFTLPREV